MNRTIAPLLVSLLALAATAADAAPVYRLKELGGGAGTQAMAISNNDLVVGWTQQQPDGPHLATIWRKDGGLQVLGALPGDILSAALGVNRAGQVVGYSGYAMNPQAFIWDAAGGMRAIGNLDPGNPNSSALGISDDGTVIGHAVTPDGALHAITWTEAGGMVDVDGGAFGTEALAINRHDQWVGGVLSRSGEAGVRVNAGGKRTNLGQLSTDEPHTYGAAINGAGDVAGTSVAPDGNTHAFVWDKLHGIQDLGLLPGTSFSNANGINEAGQVVGVAGGDGSVPFYYDKRTGMVPLASLIADDDPHKAEVVLTGAQAINDRGVIVVNGTLVANGLPRAYLLVPR